MSTDPFSSEVGLDRQFQEEEEEEEVGSQVVFVQVQGPGNQVVVRQTLLWLQKHDSHMDPLVAQNADLLDRDAPSGRIQGSFGNLVHRQTQRGESLEVLPESPEDRNLDLCRKNQAGRSIEVCHRTPEVHTQTPGEKTADLVVCS